LPHLLRGFLRSAAVEAVAIGPNALMLLNTAWVKGADVEPVASLSDSNALAVSVSTIVGSRVDKPVLNKSNEPVVGIKIVVLGFI
jgi:hypothetical protein